MRLEIFIVSYNRPQYLSMLLESLSCQHLGEWQIDHIHLMQDGPNPVRADTDRPEIDRCVQLYQQIFPQGHVHAAETNIGINGNYAKIVHDMQTTEADAIIVFEDDLDLSPHYLNVMVRLLAYAATSRHVGMVSAKGLLGASLKHQIERQRALLPMSTFMGIHRWGWGMSKGTIAEYAPILGMYLDYALRLGFSDNGDKNIHAEKQNDLKRFISHTGYLHLTGGIEIDAMYDIAAHALGRVNLCTYANFLKPVGEVGVHFTKELFSMMHLDKTEMIEMPPDDFAWYEPDMMLHILTLFRRFIAAQYLNYNSGIFGCVVPFDNQSEFDLLHTLYEGIFGWPLTVHDAKAHRFQNYNKRTLPKEGEPRTIIQSVVPATRNYTFPYAL